MSAWRCHAFGSFDIATKFGWVNGSPGMNAVAPVADGLRGVGDKLLEATGTAENQMKNLGVTWAGPAATEAQKSLARTNNAASHTEAVTKNGADRLLDYGHSYEWLRQQIAYDDPSKHSLMQQVGDKLSEAEDDVSPIWHYMLNGGEDHISIGERNQANDAAATHALNVHAARAEAADNQFTTSIAAAPGSPQAPGAPGGLGGPGGSGIGEPPSTNVQPTAPPGGGPVGAGPGTMTPPITRGPHSAAPQPGAPAHVPGIGSGRGGQTSGPTAPRGAGPGGPGGGPGSAPGAVDSAGRGAPHTAPGGSGSTQDRPVTTSQVPDQPQLPASPRPDRAFPQAPGATPPAGADPGVVPSPGTGSPPAGPYRSDTPGNGLPRNARDFADDLRKARIAPAPSGEPTSRTPGVPGLGQPGGRPAWPGGGSKGTGTWDPAPGGRPGSGIPENGGRGSGLGSGAGPGGGGPGSSEGGGRGSGWGRGASEGSPGGRLGAGEAAAAGRSGSGSGYAPMTGGAGAGGRGDQEHRNRYLIPSDEPFDVDLDYSPPVLGPLTDERD